MPFARPTLQEIRTRVEADVAGRLGLSVLLPRSVLQVLAAVVAGAAHQLHGHLDWLADQIFPDTADADHLERLASIWGVTRKPAAFASGSVEFTGGAGILIPAGTLVQRSDGAQFATAADATISGGAAAAEVEATAAGAAGNTPGGTILSLVSPIAGIVGVVTVAGDGLVDGADMESDEELRFRLLSRIQEPPQGGSASDYETWALQVAGVTRAWSYPEYLGPGTVGLTFVVDNDPDGLIPDAGQVAEVQAYIDERRPVTADVTVFAPVAVPLDFDITLVPDTSAVRGAVEAALLDLIRREARPGGTLLLSHIREAISTAAGETDHELNGPSANVVSDPGDLSTMGMITWS